MNIEHINESIDNDAKEKVEARIAEELEERVEYGAWGTDCKGCNDNK